MCILAINILTLYFCITLTLNFMKAIILEQIGEPDNLHITEAPNPIVANDTVLVEVIVIGINPVDAFVRSNAEALSNYIHPQEREALILGWDISGIVTEVGPAVTSFKAGDEVFGMVNFPGHGKAYAQYVAAPEAHLALKPNNVTHQEAGAATLAALTAWQSLVTYAKVKEGDKVLIHAAAGGVGHYAVQMAKHLGAYVIGTASEANREFVLELGADEFIDYTSQTFEEVVMDADVVLDSVEHSQEHITRSLQALKNGGRLISLLAPVDGEFQEKAKARDIYAHQLGVESNGEDMKTIADLLGSGAVRSHVSKTFAFDDMPLAHEQIQTGKTRGKIVVTP